MSGSAVTTIDQLFAQDLHLENDVVLLRPISLSDIEEYKKIAFNDAIWKYFITNVGTDDDLEAFVLEAVNARKDKSRMAFTSIDKASGQVAGGTAYLNISFKDKRLEIGWSWLAPAFQRSGINRNNKFLLMEYAFETLGFERVEFKTDVLNQPARKGLRGIGAIEEGVLRSHTLMPFGRRRDTIYYSVLRNEWPEVKNTIFKEYKSGRQ